MFSLVIMSWVFTVTGSAATSVVVPGFPSFEDCNNAAAVIELPRSRGDFNALTSVTCVETSK